MLVWHYLLHVVSNSVCVCWNRHTQVNWLLTLITLYLLQGHARTFMWTTLVWACMWVNICETAPHNIWANCSLFYSEASHRSSRSSISLSGCAAPRLRSGRWGQPCPPLYWSVGGSSSAPPPWTKWRASGCLSAQPPPHRHAPPGYWPTEGRRRMRIHKDG